MQKMEWISVKDRMPEDGETALTYKNGLVEVQVYVKRETDGLMEIGFGQWRQSPTGCPCRNRQRRKNDDR